MWPNPQFPADLVTFTGEILNGKLHFCAVRFVLFWTYFNIYEVSQTFANIKKVKMNKWSFLCCNNWELLFHHFYKAYTFLFVFAVTFKCITSPNIFLVMTRKVPGTYVKDLVKHLLRKQAAKVLAKIISHV